MSNLVEIAITIGVIALVFAFIALMAGSMAGIGLNTNTYTETQILSDQEEFTVEPYKGINEETLTDSNNTELVENTDYEALDRDEGTYKILDAGYTNEEITIEYKANVASAVSDIAETGAETQGIGTALIPIIILIGVVVFIIAAAKGLTGL